MRRRGTKVGGAGVDVTLLFVARGDRRLGRQIVGPRLAVSGQRQCEQAKEEDPGP